MAFAATAVDHFKPALTKQYRVSAAGTGTGANLASNLFPLGEPRKDRPRVVTFLRPIHLKGSPTDHVNHSLRMGLSV